MSRNISIGLLSTVLLPVGVVISASLLAILLPIYALVFPILALGAALYSGNYLANLVLKRFSNESGSAPNEGLFNKATVSLLVLQGLFIAIAYIPAAVTLAVATTVLLPFFFLALSGYTAYLTSNLLINKIAPLAKPDAAPKDYIEQEKMQYRLYTDTDLQPLSHQIRKLPSHQANKFFANFHRKHHDSDIDESTDLSCSEDEYLVDPHCPR